MNITTIFQCEDSIDGILSAVHTGWSARLGHDHIKLQALIQESVNYELFSNYVTVETNAEKAAAVARAIKDKISERAYEMVIRAAVSTNADKADEIYRFLILGFHMGGQVVHFLSNHYVNKIFEMNRFVGNEVHFYLGFLRFEELENHVLLACYEPKSNITQFVIPHFADRMNNENFIIFDVKRRLAALHQTGHPWVMAEVKDERLIQYLERTNAEEEYKKLWLAFFKTIGIEERKNPKLQRNMLRLHYRKYMTEFQ